MTQTEFLNQLEIRLAGIPKDERNKIIEYYTEIINDKLENGESEESIFRSLGSPETIAQNILEENDDTPKSFEKPKKSKNIGKIIGFSVLLPFIIAMFALWGVVVLSFLIASFALAVSGIGLFISSFFLFFQSFMVGLCQIGFGLLLASVSVFAGYGSWQFAKLYGRAIRGMFRKYKRIYGGEYHEEI